MKYTNKQYKVAKKFREFYYQVGTGEQTGNSTANPISWENITCNRHGEWYEAYLEPHNYVNVIGDYEKAVKAKKLTDEFFKGDKMKYTEDEYIRGRKYYEFYFGIPIEDWQCLEKYVGRYMKAPEGCLKEKTAFRKTEEFFAEKENKLTPSSYTFVSTDKDVDLLRIIREAGDAQFILIEKKNRNTNKVISHLLIHEKVLNNPTVKNLKIYGLPVDRNWGIDRLGYFPGKSLIGTGYQGYWLCPDDGNTDNIRAEIEAVIKALNPKDTKTTVTVW